LGISVAEWSSCAAAEPNAAKYTPQQVAAAKKLATQLGGQLREDAQGNVISIDMATGRTWADDYQMDQILVFPKLASLVVEGPGITNQLTSRIAEQHNLASLTLKNTLVDDEGIEQLVDLKTLKVIELRVAPLISDRAMESLVKLPKLRAVRLVGGNITDRGVATLLRAPKLHELDVRNCRNVTKAGIEQIGAKGTVRVLKIGGPKIDDQTLGIVATMTHLAGLCLDNCDISDAGLKKLDRLSPEDLALHECPKVTDRGLEVLANYGNLRQLTLQGVGAKGVSLAKIPHPEKLLVLSLAQSGITDSEVSTLAGMTHLESLNLSQTAITDAAVDAIARLTSLKKLTLTQTHVGDKGAQRLRKALPRCAVRTN
jgi:Leucine-rich repeat (LRR) protein